MAATYYGRLAILKGKSTTSSNDMREAGITGSSHVERGKDGLLGKSFFGFTDGGIVYGVSLTIWDTDKHKGDGDTKLQKDWKDLMATIVDTIKTQDVPITV